MNTSKKKSLLAGIPSAALALLSLFGATIVLFGIGEGLGKFLRTFGDAGEVIPYILYDLFIAVCCYFIVKQNPPSFWYVPIICNVLGIISAIIEPNFWITPMWILVCIGWALSIIAAVAGAGIGKRTDIR